MAVFTGSGVAIVTPFTADGSAVNYKKLAELLDYQIDHKTDAIIICGTTGEGSTLSMEEHKECIRFTAEYVAGRVPVIAGTGSNSTETAIELSQDAEKDGADALLIVSPYYNKATQKGLIEHYSMIAESVSIPIIMYNVPSRTGCNILPATAVEIARRNKNVTGIKEACGNLAQISLLASLSREAGVPLDIYSGNDDEVLPILSIGGLGVISVLANVMPEETHQMVVDYLAGEREKAMDFQLKAMPLINALFCEVNPIPVKVGLNLMGMDVGPLRRPLCDMEEKNLQRLQGEMRKMGLI